MRPGVRSKVRRGVGRDRLGEPVRVQLDEGQPHESRFRYADRVERDVDVARLSITDRRWPATACSSRASTSAASRISRRR